MRAQQRAKRMIAALGAAIAVAALAATIAGAELAQKGNLLVNFSGGILPTALPRQSLAPITVLMGAKITTTDRSEPPELKRMVLDINNHGKISPDGLPLCPLAKLNSATEAGARQACGPALVGHGNVTTRVTLPNNPTFATNGGLLAFNGRLHGHPAVFALVTSGAPLPLSFVITFEINKIHGKFGTSLTGKVPPIASGYGKISAISLALNRTYTAHGRRQSYLAANCPAPAGFPSLNFAFARVDFSFADGRSVTEMLNRGCKVS